jgi:putative ABC transport system permease protein
VIAALWRGIGLALRAISRNMLRASLTVLGILIGVAAVVVVTALGSGARESVGAQIQSIGSNFIIVFPMNSAASGAKGAQGSGVRLSDEDEQAIRRDAVSVSAIAPALRTVAQVVSGDRNWSTSVVGTSLDYFTIRNWKLRRGQLWEERDEQLKTKVCILGSTVATNLFGSDDPVGRTIRIGRYPFRVVGVTETKGEAPFGGDQDDVVLMPITSARARIIRTPRNFAGILMASASSAETTERAVQQIDAILRQRHHIEADKTPDFAIRTQAEFAAMQATIYNVLTILLVCVAGISLLVGGIGVMNIMLVSVTERTREIGVRMAIGAREHDIRTQFLVEAVVLALLGGLAGAAIGIGTIAALAKVLEWPMTLSPTALAVAIATSGMTGVAFGFFPARRASRLDPIVALRHE